MSVCGLTEPTIVDVLQARQRIATHLFRPSPRRSDSLSRLTGRQVWLIPENLQRTGSFKLRGALNRLIRHRENGGGPVITVSSGNHAIGSAVAGQIAGIPVTIVVAENVSSTKLAKLESLGANVVIDGANFDQAEARMFERARRDGLEVVNAFDHDVIAGHGTAALDTFESLPDLSVLISPVASGGLISGCAVVARQIAPNCEIVGVQTTNAPAMKTSMDAGELTLVDDSPTIADGLAGNAMESVLPFQIIQKHVSCVELVDEDAILKGIWHGLAQEQLVLEGAGAATLAAVLSGQLPEGYGPVGLILSGGNISPELLQRAVGCA